MKKVLVLFIVALLLTAGACRGADGPASGFVSPGDPTFSVDFAEAPEDWCQGASYPFGDFFCESGEYHIVNKGLGNIAAQSIGPFKNFMLEAVMHLVGDTGSYGVAFRGKDQAAIYYVFRVRSSGKYQFVTWAPGGADQVLIPWTDSDALQKGEASNRLQVKAVGKRFTLYANGQELTSVSDASYAEGSLGPVVTEDGHVAVSSFRVWALP